MSSVDGFGSFNFIHPPPGDAAEGEQTPSFVDIETETMSGLKVVVVMYVV